MIRDPKILSRARGEYLEMPGMSLTVEQACRLWRLDRKTCYAVLEQLSREGFLAELPSGRFVAREHAVASTRRAAVTTYRP